MDKGRKRLRAPDDEDEEGPSLGLGYSKPEAKKSFSGGEGSGTGVGVASGVTNHHECCHMLVCNAEVGADAVPRGGALGAVAPPSRGGRCSVADRCARLKRRLLTPCNSYIMQFKFSRTGVWPRAVTSGPRHDENGRSRELSLGCVNVSQPSSRAVVLHASAVAFHGGIL